ncbi:hypothetical protein [Enterococcus sp. LJL51]|uniref:hypothetical protein n=1 Tax=Enterococcus sp. LJL51 TaxID=3416656 RepID=UPI003CF8511B
MKKKIVVSVVAVLVLIISIGRGFYVFKQKEKEAQIVEWERTVAKQIKNTFTDVKEIKFSKDYADNYWPAGFIGVSCYIETANSESTKLILNIPINDKEDLKNTLTIEAETNLRDGKIIEGKTDSAVKVIYTDSKEEDI